MITEENFLATLEETRNTYDHSRPYLNRVLKNLGLDKSYIKAKGNYLYYQDDHHNTVKVLDFVGGYGSLFLGHHYPELNQYARTLLEENLPIHSQMASKKYVGDLAAAINEKLGAITNKKYITTFTNTGAEAVEAAIKHAKFSYTVKRQRILDQITKEIQSIDNYYSSNRMNFNCELEGIEFSDFQYFKKYYNDKLQKTLSSFIPVLLAAKKAFHGKTTGALDATHNEDFRKKYQTTSHDSKKVSFFEIDEIDVEEKLAESWVVFEFPKLNSENKIILHKIFFYTCLGIIIEPIQGEGGVRKISIDFLKYLRSKTQQLDIPLIFDEIQCGFFRTGHILYSLSKGIEADYYLLGKSLGGGLVKNAALIIDQKNYIEEFGFSHTSTFADDEYSGAISLKALQLSEQMSKLVPYIGASIHKQLIGLQLKFPEVIQEVRGEGLMWGLELKSLDNSDSYCFQMVARSKYLNYFCASYLLAKWNIRVASTLSDRYTIRFQPSVVTTMEEIKTLVVALEDLCEIIHNRDFYKLISHLLEEKYQDLRPIQDFGRGTISNHVDEKVKDRVGFLTHFIDERGAKTGMEPLSILPDDVINELLEQMMEIAVPIFTGSKIVKSATGQKVNVYFLGLLFTAKMVKNMQENNVAEKYEKMCQKAVDLLQTEYGCNTVGLGQYTSVITKNGKTLANSNISITTGNSFTVGIGVQAVKSELLRINPEGKGICLGVLGAAGNISSTYVKCFVPYASKIILKGNDTKDGEQKTRRSCRELLSYLFRTMLQSSGAAGTINQILFEILNETMLFKKVKSGQISPLDFSLYDQLEEELGDANPIQILKHLNDLRNCHVTVVATSSPDAFLFPEHFSPDSIVYDISVPNNCSQELLNNDKGVKVIFGGIVQLPFSEQFPMKSYPLIKGEAFACISETILLGMEGGMGNYSYGSIHPSQVEYINSIGEKHGFKYLKPKYDIIF